jgi:hypothetical protein
VSEREEEQQEEGEEQREVAEWREGGIERGARARSGTSRLPPRGREMGRNDRNQPLLESDAWATGPHYSVDSSPKCRCGPS